MSRGDMDILGHFHCATEDIEAVHYSATPGHYSYAIRFQGGRHNHLQIRCATEKDAIQMFDSAVAAHKAHVEPWWLNDGVV